MRPAYPWIRRKIPFISFHHCKESRSASSRVRSVLSSCVTVIAFGSVDSYSTQPEIACKENIPARRVRNLLHHEMRLSYVDRLQCFVFQFSRFSFSCFCFFLCIAFEAGCRATYSYLLGFLYGSFWSDSTNVGQNTLDSTAVNQTVWKQECDCKVQAIEYMLQERLAAAFINTIDHQAITN